MKKVWVPSINSDLIFTLDHTRSIGANVLAAGKQISNVTITTSFAAVRKLSCFLHCCATVFDGMDCTVVITALPDS